VYQRGTDARISGQVGNVKRQPKSERQNAKKKSTPTNLSGSFRFYGTLGGNKGVHREKIVESKR